MSLYGVGIIGCGNISRIYTKNCNRFSNLHVVACADLDIDKAQVLAEGFGITKVLSVSDLLEDEEVRIVLNLTVPKAHAEINLGALRENKHVYTEKPLGVTREQGRQTLELAKERNHLLGGAPDTFLGAGLQTCRKLIDSGAIGKPVSATAFMTGHGPEGWHPAPEFFYQQGGGPMMDMGPYYITALVSLLGSVERVTGIVGQAFDQRTITAQERFGEQVPVETPTHIAGQMQFVDGAIGTIITSFDVWSANLPLLEIHGTEASLSLPDPNTFGGPVKLYDPRKREWSDVPLAFGYEENSRGLGVADLALAIDQKRQPRASGELCYHVLDVMQSFQESSEGGKFAQIGSKVDRPAPMPEPGITFREP